MGANFTNSSLVYWVEIPVKYKDYLGGIRHWTNVKLAQDDQFVYLKDLEPAQVKAKELFSIPFVQIYYLSENYLFRLRSSAPIKTVKTSLLWTPILRALQIKIVNENFNYFGINEKVVIKLKKSKDEEPPCASLINLEELERYIHSASSVRLKNLKWTLIDNRVLIIGTPLLPISGKTFWLSDGNLIPNGYNFEFPALSKTIDNKLWSDSELFIYWNENGKYIPLKRNAFQELSISSFRKTMKAL